MRKLRTVIFLTIFCSLFIIGFQTPAFANDSDIIFKNIDYTKQSNIRVIIDDKPIVFDVNPQIAEGRTLVPMRAIFETLGLSVSWDAATKTAKGENSNYSVSFVLGSKTATVNEQSKKLDVAANIINGRTMIPLRFLSEDMGYNVVWVGDSRLILLSKSNIIEWRYGYTLLVPPYRVVEEEYDNGTKTGKTREIKSEFDKEVAEKLKANNNVPLLIDNGVVTFYGGEHNVEFDFTNLGEKAIVAFTFKFDCYDDFGRKVKYLGIGSHTYTGSIAKSQGFKIRVGETRVLYYDLSQMGLTTVVKNIKVENVLFEDDTIWGSGKISNPTIIEQDSNEKPDNSYYKERLRQYERDLADLRSKISAAKENKNVRIMTEDQGWIWTYDRTVVAGLEKDYQDLNDSYRLFKAANGL